ncbi:GTP-binding protein TrmE N-terminus-domain-containing protein [Exophiala viscosa]|uniref:GTP-binding protein TrmE N-terminus-domain-containing protein n=1 Tax=Exophiala viscosa TaxID=2486360 RepID=A0AAN6IC21_9EURO|nr:GTP-binding protein TrmE N-terminus-domain-containing protein [Exophiala viscosa]
MSEQETKSTEESNIGGNLDAAGSASGAGSVGASANTKKTEEKKKPKKLGQKSANGTPQKEVADGDADAGAEEAPSTPQPKMEQQSRSKSRQASRARGRQQSQPPSDTDSAYRSDVSQKRKRNRNRGKSQQQAQTQEEDGGGGLLGGGGGPLDSVDEVGETVNGVTEGAGDLVNDTAGKALNKPTEALGGLLGNKKKGGQEGEDGEEDAGENEQLRLRLDINLDIEVQLKAKIHGDLTIGLLGGRRTLSTWFRRQYASSTLAPILGSWPEETRSSDTIYALSTAPGRAAIAVVRISGPACLDIYRNLCPNRPQPKPRTATLRKLYHPSVDSPADQQSRVLDNGALVLYFPAPNTVTGEDVLELHVHGGRAIVRSILDAIAACERKLKKNAQYIIRHAEPGEFTKRAFYNGRLDLTQAEALGETLAAETEQQRRLAVSGSDGGLAKRYEDWRLMLLHARGEMEALIDFSEDQHFDESPVEFMASVSTQALGLKRQIEIHLQNASKGELLRNGISIALLGAPNAGKSSLLNGIVGREAAIVSAEEGTTRDIVDVSIDLQGWLCRLGDMAGLRAGEGEASVGAVEQEGIRRARERALQSDVVVALLAIEKTPDDASLDVPINEQVREAVYECHAAGKTILIVLNKVDLIAPSEREEVMKRLSRQTEEAFPMVPADQICTVSCRNADTTSSIGQPSTDPGRIQAFLGRLTDVFAEITTASTFNGDEDCEAMSPAEAQSYWAASLSVTHRQSMYLEQCLGHLEDFLDQAQSRSVDRHETQIEHGDVDIITAAEHLRFAAGCLARITGKGEGGDVEDVLGVVFEK